MCARVGLPHPPPNERGTMPTATPKVAKDILANIDPRVDAAIRTTHAAHKDRGLKGADLARILIAEGIRPNIRKGSKDAPAWVGKEVRDYMRSHGSWVGQGRTYGMTVAEARRIMAGFLASPQVAPPEGVRYVKGQAVKAQADGASAVEVASAA